MEREDSSGNWLWRTGLTIVPVGNALLELARPLMAVYEGSMVQNRHPRIAVKLFPFAIFLQLASCAGLAVGVEAAPGHPALAPPDGQSHRGDKMVGDTLKNPEDLLALGKLYQTAKGFELRQEYFLRLLDYFLFSKDRFTGMKRAEIEKIFGPGKLEIRDAKPDAKSRSYYWGGGRDGVSIEFKDDLATGAFYVMGF